MADQKPTATAFDYTVIRAPAVTEKSTFVSQFNQTIFYVDLDATKAQIKQAVQRIFGVEVIGVNTIRQKGKTKRFRNTLGRRKDTKKAIVTLKQGQTIDITGGA
ncbi:MAG: 50S ribosomal protein L23 [Pseudomonadota bacterium]